ncbi:MAG: type II toxin-antitoxin system VapC family toxin [bacterium]|nr:type II toxin-antitoxin system VapC family toxin [bacterium]MDT8367483.1 type II toxin-antitoxin system VapC family toxin [bacterium]
MGLKKVLLDTSAYSALFRGSDQAKGILQEVAEVALNPVIIGELLSGFSGGRFEAKNRRFLDDFMLTPRVRVYPVDLDTSERYAAIWSHLRSQGTPIPTNDLWIAASAMQHGLTVLTADRHFQNVPQVLTTILG